MKRRGGAGASAGVTRQKAGASVPTSCKVDGRRKCAQKDCPPPLDAMFTFAGWGGQREAAFRRYLCEVSFSICSLVQVMRLLAGTCLLLADLVAFDVGRKAQSWNAPFRVAAPALYYFWKSVDVSGLPPFCLGRVSRFVGRLAVQVGYLAGSRSYANVRAWNIHLLVEILIIGGELCLPMMPWGILYLLLFVRMDTFYRRQSADLMSLVSGIIQFSLMLSWELHHRRVFHEIAQLPADPVMEGSSMQNLSIQEDDVLSSSAIEQNGALSVIRVEIPPSSSSGSKLSRISQPESSLLPVTDIRNLNLHGLSAEDLSVDSIQQDGEMVQQDENDDQLLFSGLEDYITYEEQEEVDEDLITTMLLNEVLEDLRTVACEPLSYDESFGAISPRTVHMYVSGSDPSQLRPSSISMFDDRLSQSLPQDAVLTRLFRKGSLIITLDVLFMGWKAGQGCEFLSQVTPPEWLEWLGLPPPGAGQRVLVQTGSKVYTLRWQGAGVLVTMTSLQVPVPQTYPIEHVTDQVRVRSHPAGEQQGSSIELEVVSSTPLVPHSAACSIAQDILRARCMGFSLPVKISEISRQDGRGCTMKVTCQLPDRYEEHMELASAAYIILEVWRGCMILQSVPVLVFPRHLQQISCELQHANEKLGGLSWAESGEESMVKSFHSYLSKLGVFFHFVDKLKADSLGLGSAEMPGGSNMQSLVKRMAVLGRQLLEYAIVQGWVDTADAILESLCVSMRRDWADIMMGLNDSRLSLLHLAVMSNKLCLVAAAIKWGNMWGKSWSWNVVDIQGVTPLHYLASTGNEKMVAAVLRHFVSARKAWSLMKSSSGFTPQELAAAAGMDIKMESLKSGPAKTAKQAHTAYQAQNLYTTAFGGDTEPHMKVRRHGEGKFLTRPKSSKSRLANVPTFEEQAPSSSEIGLVSLSRDCSSDLDPSCPDNKWSPGSSGLLAKNIMPAIGARESPDAVYATAPSCPPSFASGRQNSTMEAPETLLTSITLSGGEHGIKPVVCTSGREPVSDNKPRLMKKLTTMLKKLLA